MFIYIIGLLVLTTIGFIFYINSGVKLPPETNKIVQEVMANLPEMVTGETAMAKSGEVDIWFEKMTPPNTPKGTVLLVMGHSSTAMLWPAEFCQVFVDAGYQVIRYDNRDVGLSTWMKNWDRNKPYTLEDMAKDGMAVLNAAGVDKAHIIGASMGGMIAQRMAISHSDRVLSLTSIMSSGYMLDPDIAPVPKSYMQNFIKLGLRYLITGKESGSMKFFIAVHHTLRGTGDYPINIKAFAEIALYETRKRRGFNKDAVKQHAVAIEVSGSRLEELRNITVPVAIIHGKADPLVIFAHAEKYAPKIPHAETLFLDGMGHDMPEMYMEQMMSLMLRNIEKA